MIKNVRENYKKDHNNGHKNQDSQRIIERARLYQERRWLKSALESALSSVLGDRLKSPRYAGEKRIRLTYHPTFEVIAKATLEKIEGKKK